MDAEKITIYSFTDFRDFLQHFYMESKRKSPRFSHRFISQKVGASSSGWFSDVVKGRIGLSGSHLFKLTSLMGLAGQEAAYFEALVQYGQADSIEEKNHHFRKLLAFKEWQGDTVGEDKFEYYSKWYYAAVRELLFIHEFKADYQALGKKMRPPISARQAKEAIALLSRLGFIKKDAGSVFRPREATLKKEPGFKSLLTTNYLKANMELGMHALEKVPKEQRHISAMTLPLSGPGFEKALAEIEMLRKKLLLLTEDGENPDKVYQINFQLFPVTN